MTGQEFRERRRQLGATQAQLGAVFGLSRRSVIAWENGEAPIPRLAELALRYLLEHPEACGDVARNGRRQRGVDVGNGTCG
jgi:DNA-binding XRE family transcriptional regulator